MLIVSCDELRLTLHYGLTRLMARLGYRERFYLTAPWADRARAEVASPTEPQSLLTQMRTLPFYKGAVIREKSGKVVLKMLPGAKELLRDLRARADSPDMLTLDMLTLMVSVDPSADGCLVWQPGQQSQGAITRFSSGDRLSANFINFAVLGGDRVHDESRLRARSNSPWAGGANGETPNCSALEGSTGAARGSRSRFRSAATRRQPGTNE